MGSESAEAEFLRIERTGGKLTQSMPNGCGGSLTDNVDLDISVILS